MVSLLGKPILSFTINMLRTYLKVLGSFNGDMLIHFEPNSTGPLALVVSKEERATGSQIPAARMEANQLLSLYYLPATTGQT